MSRNDLMDDILALPVFDTHTHLNIPGVPIPARNVWDIVHYFWFLRELQAAGYPSNAASLDERKRIPLFVEAFERSANTTMHWVVRRIFQDLYGIELSNAESISKADAAVKDSFSNPTWPREVIDRIGVRRIGVNHVEHADFPGLAGVGCALPVNGGIERAPLVDRLVSKADARDSAATVKRTIQQTIDSLQADGIRGIRLDASAFAGSPLPVDDTAIGNRSLDQRQATKLVSQWVLESLSTRGMFAQMFLGVSKDEAGVSGPINDTRLIVDLHALFKQYACEFELVIGAELSNLDAVQAARIFPNVHVGGMWWYNFRQSTYLQSMAYRIEALPAEKSCIVASDARCIEWCYGKIAFIKTILSEFLSERIARGWLSREEALRVAREWLHDAAARRYI